MTNDNTNPEASEAVELAMFMDPICPWCYIGYTRAKQAMALRPDIPVNWNWYPFQLNPDMPEEGMDRTEYLENKFGGPQQAKTVYGRIAQAAYADGLKVRLDNIKRTPNTINALQLIREAQYQGLDEEMVTRMFRAYFEESEDIGDIETLKRLGQEVGVKALDELFKYNQHKDILKQQDVAARQMGLTGVPCFLINGKSALPGAQSPDAIASLLDVGWQEIQQGKV
ncbi:DsbA family oxidoreductase [Kiloniella sp. b19]|uniref:DsbA family oxidoreductase n=1 Tax=Kiloniella sp. GXU_MW_B19 TaxID=3141326 RepID=UPI0031DF73E1